MAAVAGALAFVAGLAWPLLLLTLNTSSDDERLYLLNAAVGGAIVYLLLGGFLAAQATSALGGATSSPMPFGWAPYLLPFFPFCIVIGQLIATNPQSLPWLFPAINVAMVSIPAIVIAALVARRYTAANALCWPISWREWTSGFTYGAIGATTMASIINSLYIRIMAAWLVSIHDIPGDLDTAVLELPRRWGIFLDLSALSLVAPLNEEFWKGMLVAFFFFRRGSAARCFVWGVLAGTGFNLLETFVNSLGAISPEALADRTIGTAWWWFATARAGTAAMHGLASGLSALGFYGLLRGRPRYLLGYGGGVLLHGTWNLLVYAVWGDAIFSQAGPDSLALDIAGISGMVLVFAASLALLWYLSGALTDGVPAHIYRILRMRPATAAAASELQPASPPLSRVHW